MRVPKDIAVHIEQLTGLECSRREIGQGRSLFLGFGKISTDKRPTRLREYRDWELGTYYGSWRIIRDHKVLIGSQDAFDSIVEWNQALAGVTLGDFVQLVQRNEFDVRVELSCGACVEFLAAHSEDDETFHIRCPGRLVIKFSISNGWRIGPSDRPWGSDSGG